MTLTVGVGMVLKVPLMDGATMVQGTVIYADEHVFRIRFDETWPGRVELYDQGTPGVVLIADR